MRLIQAPLCGVGSKDGTAVAGKHPIDDIQNLDTRRESGDSMGIILLDLTFPAYGAFEDNW